MSDQPTSRSLAALKEILAGVECTLVIFERFDRSLVNSDDPAGTKLRNLRRQLSGADRRAAGKPQTDPLK